MAEPVIDDSVPLSGLTANTQEIKDIRKVLTALDEIVAEAGEGYLYQRHIYGGPNLQCRYVVDDKPDCIAGRVLHKLGVSLEELASNEGKRCDLIRTGLSMAAMDVLRQAQVRQDTGATWGVARQCAHGRARSHYNVVLEPPADAVPTGWNDSISSYRMLGE